MTARFKYLILLLFLYACARENNEASSPPPLFKAPQVVKLNTDEGYEVNQFNRDTIRPIVNGNGDTIITGKAFAAKGLTIVSDSLEPPKVLKVDIDELGKSGGSELNNFAKPSRINVDLDSLKVVQYQDDTIERKGHYLINSIGDTIPSGVKIPAKFVQVSAIQTKSKLASPPQFKDVAVDNIQYMDVDQGLITSYVYSVIEDRNGNLWFGYDAGGVSRYDGIHFTHFSASEGLNDDFINTIFEDSKGRIWFGTFYNGLSCFDGKTFKHLTETEGLSNYNITSITEDQEGNIWFGSARGGLNKFDGNNLTHYTVNEGLTNNYVIDLLVSKVGDLWIATYGGGLLKFDGKSFTQIQKKDGLSSDFLWSLLEDREGNIWASTYDGGVNKFDGQEITWYKDENGLNNNNVIAQYQDDSGNFWFGTIGSGLNRFDGEKFSSYTAEEGLSSNFIRNITEDSYGNIWVSTDGGGVNRIDLNSFSVYTKQQGLEDNYSTSIKEDEQGRMWIGTFNKGVSVYDQGVFNPISESDGFIYTRIWDISSTESGDIWFATHGDGAIRFDGKSFTKYSEDQGLSSNFILSIFEDSKGGLWFGTSGSGLVYFDGEDYMHFDDENGLSHNDVLTILEDQKGNIWIGTHGGGVNKYDGNSFTHFTEKEGLANNVVWSIAESDEGILWFGTKGGGVNSFDGEKFTYFSKSNGLSNNTVWSLEEDSVNSIWVGTENGLNKLTEVTDQESEDTKEGDFIIKSFSKNDGLKGLDFINNSVCIDRDQVLWLGSGKGLTRLDLNNFKGDTNSLLISLVNLEINEEFIDFRNASDSIRNIVEYDSVKAFYNYPHGLVLPYHKNHLTFYFSAIDLGSPHKLRYSHFVDGGSSAWSKASAEGKADYRNLPYGTHTLKVKAIGASQEWSDSFEYTFTILPPWYHSWWARGLYLVFAMLLIWGYARWRTATLKERQLQLEYQINEATQEISAQKQEAEKQRDVIEEAHNEIKDSIYYAKRIQSAILPPIKLLKEYLPKSFVIYKPKDVVAGDFYWLEKRNDKVLFAAADCTGHGVPGAMVSVICNNGLNRSVREYGITEPAKILDKTREIVVQEFEKSDEEVRDGMDIALCALKENTLEYSGAHNPLWLIRKGEFDMAQLPVSDRLKTEQIDEYHLLEIKADKQPIGKNDAVRPYVNYQIPLIKGDRIYIFSDGFADQFGGQMGKKLKTANLKRFLISVQDQSIAEQGAILDEHFEVWKGELEQVDDVCFIGVEA